MALTTIEKIKGILMDPVPALHHLREEDLADALAYFMAILVIYAVLSTIVSFLALLGFATVTGAPLHEFGSLLPLLIFGFTIIGGLLGIFVGGAWFHLWVFAFGGKMGYKRTVRSLIYGSTPAMILGWIPIVSLVGAVWAFALQVLGIRELQGLSTAQALLAVLVSIIIPVVILAFLFYYFLFTLAGPAPYGYGVLTWHKN